VKGKINVVAGKSIPGRSTHSQKLANELAGLPVVVVEAAAVAAAAITIIQLNSCLLTC
jgi:hypothetical protein